jgi:alpha-1,2-mannosyltransferase
LLIGQYFLFLSPEKDHAAQLQSFFQLLKSHPEYQSPSSTSVMLVLVGGSRNAGDAARVESLRALSKELGIDVSDFVHQRSCCP